eukprot:6186986-Pleurochrysis_carterae.AAC.6
MSKISSRKGDRKGAKRQRGAGGPKDGRGKERHAGSAAKRLGAKIWIWWRARLVLMGQSTPPPGKPSPPPKGREGTA